MAQGSSLRRQAPNYRAISGQEATPYSLAATARSSDHLQSRKNSKLSISRKKKSRPRLTLSGRPCTIDWPVTTSSVPAAITSQLLGGGACAETAAHGVPAPRPPPTGDMIGEEMPGGPRRADARSAVSGADWIELGRAAHHPVMNSIVPASHALNKRRLRNSTAALDFVVHSSNTPDRSSLEIGLAPGISLAR